MPELVGHRAQVDAHEAVRLWAPTLEAMELHLEEIRAGLTAGLLPIPYEVPSPDCPVPPSLSRRALRLLAAQRDLEEALRERMASLRTALSGALSTGLAPDPVYVDRRG